MPTPTLEATTVTTPCLVVDLSEVARAYDALIAALPDAFVHFAVKANPEPAILRLLVARGSRFDVASPAEIDACLAAGARPADLAYSHPIKKRSDIAYAYGLGVRTFVLDSECELVKLIDAAPGATVLCRLTLPPGGDASADWPLSGKFGCDPATAARLLCRAVEAGLDAAGVAFHVGSQQRDPDRWDDGIALAAEVWRRCAERGVVLRLLDLGGGLPGAYQRPAPPLQAYRDAILASLARHFGTRRPQVVLEPGRSLVADAGTLVTEVVGVADRVVAEGTARRWVYLDCGVFGGLAECLDEAVRYRITTSRDGGPVGEVVLAGPTCDSVDVLYERERYALPLDLGEGDRVVLHGTGAYTASYASVGFNGFAPLRVHCVG